MPYNSMNLLLLYRLTQRHLQNAERPLNQQSVNMSKLLFLVVLLFDGHPFNKLRKPTNQL